MANETPDIPLPATTPVRDALKRFKRWVFIAIGTAGAAVLLNSAALAVFVNDASAKRQDNCAVVVKALDHFTDSLARAFERPGATPEQQASLAATVQRIKNESQEILSECE